MGAKFQQYRGLDELKNLLLFLGDTYIHLGIVKKNYQKRYNQNLH